MKPEIIISNRQRSLRPNRTRLLRILSVILEEYGRDGSLSVALVGDREIQRINREFLNRDSPTDVIAFNYQEESTAEEEEKEAGEFGEIVISAETAVREARARGIQPRLELERYAIHGLLHILGYDDSTAASRRRMRELERRYLKRFSESSGTGTGTGTFTG